jgi:hypothetical protein
MGKSRYLGGKLNLVPLGSGLSGESQPLPDKSIRKAKIKRRFPPLGHPTNFIDKVLVNAIVEFFNEQEKDVLANMEADREAFEPKAVKFREMDFISAWFDKNKWTVEFENTVLPLIRESVIRAGKAGIIQTGSSREFDTLNPLVNKSLEAHKGGWAQVHSETVKQLRMALASGLAEGESMIDLKKRLMSKYEGFKGFRAERIARTEAIWAWNEGAVQGYMQSGIVNRKEWVSSGDSRSCDFCPTLNGETIGVEREWFGKGDIMSVGDSSLSFEYEGIGHPPLHPNCRCSIMAVVEEV